MVQNEHKILFFNKICHLLENCPSILLMIRRKYSFNSKIVIGWHRRKTHSLRSHGLGGQFWSLLHEITRLGNEISYITALFLAQCDRLSHFAKTPSRVNICRSGKLQKLHQPKILNHFLIFQHTVNKS